MASIYQLKPAFQALLRPCCRLVARRGVTANQVTIAAAILSAAAGAAVAWQPTARWPLLVVPAAALVRMALNALDGMLAREHGMASPLGAILNEVGDVVSDACMYLPLALVPGVPPAGVVVLVVLGLVAEMTGVVAVQVGATRRYDGPIGKSDRAFGLSALALLLGLGVSPGWWIGALLAALCLGSALAILNRARGALRARTAPR